MGPVTRIGADGRYRVKDLLGIGGMARVYRATDQESGRSLAVKLVSVYDPRVRAVLARRLRAEAKAMSRIAHPNVLTIHEVGEEGDVDYIVMDLAEGGSLKERLDRHGPMPPGVALSYMVQVLSALAAAHAAGIVHRDVKPHNVLLGSDDRALLADFGVAMLAYEDNLRNTRSNATLGSLWFMPPEQRLDPRKVDGTADVYACGATLYNLLTDASPMDLFTEPEGSKRWNNLPDPIRRIIQRAVSAKPADRYPSVEAMARDIIALLPTLDEAAYQTPLWPRRPGTPDHTLEATREERFGPHQGTTHMEEGEQLGALREHDPVRSAITFLVDDIEDLREQVLAGTLFDGALMEELAQPAVIEDAPPESAPEAAPEPHPEASPPAPAEAQPMVSRRAHVYAGLLLVGLGLLFAGWFLSAS